MSSNFRYNVGLNHVPSYQASSPPYFTSSLTVPASGSTPLEISFPSVSRFVVITNDLDATDTQTPVRFGASSAGVQGTNYGLLKNGQSFEAEFKVTKIYLMSNTANETSASIVAGLTGSGATHLPDKWSGSA